MSETILSTVVGILAFIGLFWLASLITALAIHFVARAIGQIRLLVRAEPIKPTRF